MISPLLGQETPLELIRSQKAKNPRELSTDERAIYVMAAKQLKNNGSYKTEGIRFLIEAGDRETIQETLATARNYESYGPTRQAWLYFQRSANPDLLALLHDAMRDDGPAGLKLYANEHYDAPSSTRAALATLSIITRSKAFSPEVTEWAVQIQSLTKNNRYEELRERARAFSTLNLEVLRDKRYLDAIIPPDRPAPPVNTPLEE
jgi:hypothetical protein